jgi:DNA-damage-inducible protein J
MPNAETVEAMKAARRGELTKIGGIDNLLADLHADD